MLAIKKQILGDFEAQGQMSNTHCHSSGSMQGGRERKGRTERSSDAQLLPRQV